jgi:hypothetical protein
MNVINLRVRLDSRNHIMVLFDSVTINSTAWYIPAVEGFCLCLPSPRS